MTMEEQPIVKPVLCKYPHIGKFSDLVKYVIGAKGEIPITKITFIGTVKLDGTNCSICQRGKTRWFQSRNRILSEGEDHHGFVEMCKKDKLFLDRLIGFVQEKECNDDYDTVCVYGELVGKGIQNRTAISKLDKMFVIFEVNVQCSTGEYEPFPIDFADIQEYFRDTLFGLAGHSMYFVTEFPHWQLAIDFKHPEKSVDTLDRITESVSVLCPVASQFGEFGIGEGVVWKSDAVIYSNLAFKVKNPALETVKVSHSCSVGAEVFKKIYEFVDYSITENRLSQGAQELFDSGVTTCRENTGKFVEWVIEDICREEASSIEQSDLDKKLLNKAIGKRAAKWWLDKCGQL